MYKTEYILGLIGSILATVSASLILIFSLLIGALLRMPGLTDSGMYRFFGPMMNMGAHVAGAFAILIVVFSLILIAAAATLGFIGTSKLKSGNKRGGIPLVIAGGLLLLPPYLGSGVFGTAISILFFIGGIMALTKKVNPT